MAAPGEGAPLNFAAASKGDDGAATPLTTIQVDGQVVMKIVKHCKECMPSLVTGPLLGLDIGSTLEVTNCFPFPSRSMDDEEADEVEGANYQLEMLHCLRDVNVDSNTVGWYQSTYLGSYHTEQLIETFLNYAQSIKRCVCLIYDPTRSSQGTLALKAIRLTDGFMEMYRAGDVSAEKLTEKGLAWTDVFAEIPVQVRNSTLVSTLMREVAPAGPMTQVDYDRLVLSTNPFLEKNLEFLVDCMDDLAYEAQRVSQHQRNVQRLEAQRAQWIQKRRQENAQRKAAGQEPLPDEEPGNPLFKNIPEPSRLDTLLITNQIGNYCSQINQFSSQSLQKLYLMQGIQS